MSETEDLPIRQVPEIIKFHKSMKILKVIFWFLKIFAFLGFGLLLQGKFIPYPSSSVRIVVHLIVLLASLLSLMLSFLCNLLMINRLNNLTLIGCLVQGLKVNQLLLLAKNKINSKNTLRRRLAIYALPLVSSEEVLEVLTKLEIVETSHMKEAIKNARQQVKENLANSKNLLEDRTPYRDLNGNYISTYPLNIRALVGPIIRFISNFCFLGITLTIRGVLSIIFVGFPTTDILFKTIILIGIGLFFITIFPIVLFFIVYLDLRKVTKLFDEKNIQELVNIAYFGTNSRSNSRFASYAFLALAELGVEGTIELLKPVLGTSNKTLYLTVVFSLDVIAVKTEYPERFFYRILP